MDDQVRTLIVDDEEGIRYFLDQILQREGHSVMTAASGEEALACLNRTCFDLIMLDLRLGGRIDGMRVLEAVKWRWPETAVIILTAYGSLDSALAAIREGVDGYLLKPSEPKELRQVVREVLARREHRGSAVETRRPADLLQWRTWAIERDKHLALLNGQPLDLTPREFRLLAYLVEHAPRIISPQELVQATLGYEPRDVTEAREVIKWYIHRLRRKAEPDPSRPRYILNVRGVGYGLAGEESAPISDGTDKSAG